MSWGCGGGTGECGDSDEDGSWECAVCDEDERRRRPWVAPRARRVQVEPDERRRGLLLLRLVLSRRDCITFSRLVITPPPGNETPPSCAGQPFSDFILQTALLLEERCNRLVDVIAIDFVPCDRWSSRKVTANTGNNVETSVGSNIGDLKHRVFRLDSREDVSI